MNALYCKASRLRQVVVLALLIALGTMGTGANSAYAATMVPFDASFSGTAIPTDPLVTVQFSGTGIATHMGLITNGGVATVHPNPTPWPVPCAGGVANTHIEKLTAANGDELDIESHNVACPTGPSSFHGTGIWFVIGGTGRFSGASGAGTLDGRVDFSTGAFTILLTGQISAPNGG